MPIHLPDETPLQDFVRYVTAATRGPNGTGVPIFVNFIGWMEADKTLDFTISPIDFEGVPLKRSLELCLGQLGLTYSVGNGLLVISAVESEINPYYHDSFMIVGHCLLTLLAAGLGGFLAPLVPGKCREP